MGGEKAVTSEVDWSCDGTTPLCVLENLSRMSVG